MPRRDSEERGADRHLRVLERLLGIGGAERRPALDEASTLLADALGAEKVDVFLFDPGSTSLVAFGTSATPMGAEQKRLGLDHLPVANGGRVIWVYRTGEAFLTGRSDEDPEELRGVVEGLGVRSSLLVPLTVAGERRGVLSFVSPARDRFDQDDRRFAEAAAGWVGMVLHRAELVEQATAEAEERGRRDASEDLARLTRREQEVAARVAEGLTSGEIAGQLVLTEGTVANHVQRALRKLGLRSRTALAVWAVERGLYRPGRDGAER